MASGSKMGTVGITIDALMFKSKYCVYCLSISGKVKRISIRFNPMNYSFSVNTPNSCESNSGLRNSYGLFISYPISPVKHPL